MGWRELLGGGRGRLTVGILLVEFVAAVQSSVVASIMPAVARDIGGIQFYGLVFSGYALASIAATPTAGWRWAFFALLPLIAVALLMVVPGLAKLPGSELQGRPLGIRWPLLLAAGTGVLVTGLTMSSWLAIPVAAAGLALLAPAAVRVMPP